MAKTSVSCPNCHQPITIELTRLFDMNTNPDAKEALLSGSANYFQCPVCKYQGVYPTPIVYHDPEKELLLTFFPPEIAAPLPEQERVLGPMIKKVVDDLPVEKRKAYIFRPQAMLTQQRLFETILEADGITPEMMKAQQEKLALIQQLARAKADALPELIAQNDAKVDEEFFVLMSRLAQASAAAGDREGAQLLVNLQKALLQHSTYGKAAAEEAKDSRAAVEDLQALSKSGLTRESLLDLLARSADKEIRLTTIATMARGGLDYQFFQILSERIDAAAGEEKNKLVALRDKLLNVTTEVDHLLELQSREAKVMLDELLKAENLEEATQEALPRMNQVFADVVTAEAQTAQQNNDQEKLKKLVTIVAIMRQASSSGAYLEIIDALLQVPDQAARRQVLEQAGDAVDSEFMQVINNLVSQLESQNEEPEIVAKLKDISREVLRFSMERNLARENPA